LVTVVRPDGTILYDSPACERIIGYGFGERIGRNSLEYLHPYDHERIERVFYEIINNVSMNSAVEYRLRHKSGSYVHLEGVGRLTTDESGEPVIVANIRDVTERKVKQEQLEQLSDRLRNLKDEERRRLARELHDDTAQN